MWVADNQLCACMSIRDMDLLCFFDLVSCYHNYGRNSNIVGVLKFMLDDLAFVA
jgi:hypothetical protein